MVVQASPRKVGHVRGKLLASLGCVVSMAALMGGVGPASAAPPPFGRLHLTVHQGEAVAGPVVAEADLWCHPAGGSHPTPDAACAALDAAGGDPARIPAAPGTCATIYAPVTAVATGHWRGGAQRIDFTRTYGNRCALHNAKTPLFDF
jgi:subtilisin inhibitor-like